MDAARDFEQLDEIQAEMETQDNLATADPIFMVEQKGRFGQWDLVQPFLTRKAADDYIEANRHNLRSPRVFVASAYRNYEWQLMRRVPKLVASLREALEERAHDMHLRIRAGYDKTVADSWRAANAKLQAENDALGERVAVLEGSDVPVSVMEFTVVRVATAGKWFAKGWVNGQIVRGPDALSMGEAVNAYCAALAAAKPAAQEGKEQQP